MTPSPARRGLGPGVGGAPAWLLPPPPAAAPAAAPPPSGPARTGGDGSAEQAHQALSRLRLVPVQAAVLEAALALARSVLAGQAGHPAVQESARAVSTILDLALVPPGPRPAPAPSPLRSVPAPTVAGTGNARLSAPGPP